jgi:hypothetical protein
MTLGREPVIRHLKQPMMEMPAKSRVTRHKLLISPRNNCPRFTADPDLFNPPSPRHITQKTSRPRWTRSSMEL